MPPKFYPILILGPPSPLVKFWYAIYGVVSKVECILDTIDEFWPVSRYLKLIAGRQENRHSPALGSRDHCGLAWSRLEFPDGSRIVLESSGTRSSDKWPPAASHITRHRAQVPA